MSQQGNVKNHVAETGRVSGFLCQAPSEIHRRLA
jgi:hypothetical protein